MDIKKTQCLLYAAGIDPGPIDGIDGPKTQAAIAEGRRLYGCGPEGLIGILAGTVPQLDGNAPAAPAEDLATDWWPKYPNFRLVEYTCHCGGRYCSGHPADVKQKLVALNQKIRDHYGKPVIIISGLRCPTWNTIQGGVPTSLHQYGQATDFRIDGEDPRDIVAWIKASCPECNYVYAIKDSNGALCGTVHVDVK